MQAVSQMKGCGKLLKIAELFYPAERKKSNPNFLKRFDLIFVADHKVLNELYKYATTPEYKAKMHLITHFSRAFHDQEVPDPYYQGEAGFEQVLDMLVDSCEGILTYIKKNYSNIRDLK